MELESSYKCRNGLAVTIRIDEIDYRVTVIAQDGAEVGSIEFLEIDDDFGSYLKLVWAFLDQGGKEYLHQGIGRECLKRVKEFSGMPIVAQDNDGGIVQDDGSHLTGDAPYFVDRMRSEGVIAPSRYGDKE